uniref:Phage protein n=1 Tax=Panagrolaimus davidi TaxID=227884 RepID=A0A914Q0W3_9BILA
MYFEKGKAIIDLKAWITDGYGKDLSWNYNASAFAIRDFLDERGHKTYFFNVFIMSNWMVGDTVTFSCYDEESCFFISDFKECHIFASRYTFEYARSRKSQTYLKENERAIHDVLL